MPHKPLRLRGGTDLMAVTGHLRIAALNIKGANSPQTRQKWNLITNKMRKNKIAVMCISETHTDSPQKDQLANRYGNKFHITHTFDPDHSRAAGVAIIVNRNVIKKNPTGMTILIPG